VNDGVVLVIVTAAAAADLKQIDSEMQAILAELLMSCPQPAELTRPSFPVPADDTVMTDPVSNSQSQVVSQQQQQLQTPGMLSSLPLISLKTSDVKSGFFRNRISFGVIWIKSGYPVSQVPSYVIAAHTSPPLTIWAGERKHRRRPDIRRGIAPCSIQVTTLAPHHSVFLQSGCSFCHPTNIVKAVMAQTIN